MCNGHLIISNNICRFEDVQIIFYLSRTAVIHVMNFLNLYMKLFLTKTGT